MPVPLLAPRIPRFITASLLSIVPLLTASCDGGAATDVNAPVTFVRVDPSGETMFTGGSRTFTAVAQDAVGATVAAARFAWESSDTAVAVVDSAGTVTAHRSGTATITARAGVGVGSATVYVAPAASLEFVQSTGDGGLRFARDGNLRVILLPGDSVMLLLMMRGGGGYPLTPPLSGALWASSDTTVLRARTLPQPGDSGVVLRALSPGESTVSARYQGVTTGMVVHVAVADSLVPTYRSILLPSGGHEVCMVIQAFTPLGRLEMDPRHVRWASSDTSVARLSRLISNAGCLTTGTAGSATFTAEVAGLSTRTDVRVADVRVGRLTPAVDTIAVGDSLLVRAAWGDGLGDWFDYQLDPTWSSSDPAIASVEGGTAARVIGKAPGWTVVTAWVEGVFAQATVFVLPPASSASARASATQSRSP